MPIDQTYAIGAQYASDHEVVAISGVVAPRK